MPSIQCTRTLWRRLDRATRVRERVPERIFQGVVLGNWIAKMFRYDKRELVIALDERTYAVVLFPLSPRYHFRPHFAAALAGLLEDLGVPASVVAQECAAIQFAPLTRLDSSPVLETLSHAQYLCELDLFDMSDLRDIQLHVNDYPHAAGPAPCAIEALAEIFAPALVRRCVRH
jgi:hypothetical protein